MAENSNFVGRFTSIYTDKSINGWVRGVAWIGTAAVIYIVGNIAYKAIFKSSTELAALATAKALDSSITQHKNQGMAQTFNTPNYSSFADSLYDDLGNPVINYTDDAVSILTKMQTDLDVELLTKAFGSRPAHKLWGVISVGSDPVSLSTIVRETMGSNSVTGGLGSKIEDINKDWSNKGITYKL